MKAARKEERICLISACFYPEQIGQGKYNTHLASALADSGAQVTVITAHPWYPQWRAVRSYGTLAGVTIHRGGAWARYPKSHILRRAWLELWFAFFVVAQLWKRRRAFDTVVAVFPPNLFLFLGSWILPRSIRRIGVVHDLQGVFVKPNAGLFGRLVRHATHWIEGSALRACNRLIFLSQRMADEAVESYRLDRGKITVQYPFVTLDPAANGEGTLDAQFQHAAINVVYCGALGQKQNPQALADFFHLAATEFKGLGFHIFSEGPIFERLRQEFLDSPVRFHSLVAEDCVAELYRRSDVQVIPQASGTSDGSLPSKLPNVLASGCAVLAITDEDSELGHWIRSTDTGCVVHSWDPAELMAALRKLVERVEMQSRGERQQNAAEVVNSHFTVGRLVEKVMTAGAGR